MSIGKIELKGKVHEVVDYTVELHNKGCWWKLITNDGSVILLSLDAPIAQSLMADTINEHNRAARALQQLMQSK